MSDEPTMSHAIKKLRGFFSFSLNEMATKEKKQKKVANLCLISYERAGKHVVRSIRFQ